MSRLTIHDFNDSQRAMIPAGVRGAIGKAAMTTADAVAQADAKAEAEIQGDIANYLNLHGIIFIRPPMNKRSTLPPGWPDFTFCYRGVAVGAEAKTAIGKLSSDQVTCREQMARNGWRVPIVRSVADVQSLLRSIDAEIDPPAVLAEIRKEARL